MPMVHTWPNGAPWLNKLYTNGDSTIADVMLIAIDDDGGRSFSDIYTNLYKVFKEKHPDLNLWCLHLGEPTFNQWIELRLVDEFELFINERLQNRYLEMTSSCNQKRKEKAKARCAEFNQYKKAIILAGTKIWIVDLREEGGTTTVNSSAMISSLGKLNRNCRAISQNIQEAGTIAENYLVSKLTNHQLEQNPDYYYSNLILPFLPKIRLHDLSPKTWHQLRFHTRNKMQSQHHWKEGKDTMDIETVDQALTELRKVTFTLNDPKTGTFNKGTISLDNMFIQCRYKLDDKYIFDSDDPEFPSIRAILQTNLNGKAKNLTHYFEVCKKEIEKLYSYIDWEAEGTQGQNDALWFNVVALYHSLINIIKSYPKYVNNNEEKKIHIRIDQNDSSKKIIVKITEHNLNVMHHDIQLSLWPYSSREADHIHPNTKDLLQLIQNQGACKVLYHVARIWREANFNKGNWSGKDNVNSGDNDYTFKWEIEASEYAEPYPYAKMPKSPDGHPKSPTCGHLKIPHLPIDKLSKS
ncbi:MAG: hypothetical protein Q7J31_04505 [Syntrophales bacterium]|nr:hypothetical protein [Syntrophales bacterium]